MQTLVAERKPLTPRESKLPYEKPLLVKEQGMTFPLRILHHGKEVICKQCSSCHACR